MVCQFQWSCVEHVLYDEPLPDASRFVISFNAYNSQHRYYPHFTDEQLRYREVM